MEQFSHGQFSSMKRWSLQDKKADGVTVINFMQILAELKLTRRESDPELWGMSGPQHIIRGQQYKGNVLLNALNQLDITVKNICDRELTWRKASSVLKLGVFGVTIEIGTGDLDAWNQGYDYFRRNCIFYEWSVCIPGENFASLLIWNSSLLSEQIRKGDSPFCRGASRT